MMNKKNNNKGYTLLFAVLVSSLVLSVGISILTISKKEFLLSTAARESTKAFYAADAVLECMVYHAKNPVNDIYQLATTTSGGVINCMGEDYNVSYDEDSGEYTANFDILVRIPGTEGKPPCAIVSIVRSFDEDDLPVTEIESSGYNTGWDDADDPGGTDTCSLVLPNKVERTLYYQY